MLKKNQKKNTAEWKNRPSLLFVSGAGKINKNVSPLVFKFDAVCMNQQLGYVEMQAVMLVTLSITFVCPLETLSSLLCIHFPSVVLVVVLF